MPVSERDLLAAMVPGDERDFDGIPVRRTDKVWLADVAGALAGPPEPEGT